MIISPHARMRMKEKGIHEEDVIECVGRGERIHIEEVDGEIRYVHGLDTKLGKIMVVWTIRKGKKRVITCYWRKRRWLRK